MEKTVLTPAISFVLHRLFVLSIVLVYAFQLSAQPLHYSSFQVEDGLPCPEAYEVLQDQQGYIWVATDMGVARYDGYRFESFSSDDGLLDNSVLAIYEDHKGRIWFPSASRGLCYWENDSIHTYTFNDSLLKHIPSGQTDRIHLDRENTLWVVPYNEPGLLKITARGKCSWHFKTPQLSKPTAFVKVFDAEHSLSGYTHKMNLPTPTAIPLVVEYSDNTQQHFTVNYTNFNANESHVASLDSLYFAQGNTLYLINNSTLTQCYKYDAPIISIYKDVAGTIWVTTRKALYTFTCETTLQPQKIFQGMGSCFVTQDHEGAHWITTLNNGLIYLPKIQWKNILTTDQNQTKGVANIDVDNRVIVAATLSGDVKICNDIQTFNFQTLPGNIDVYIPEVKLRNDTLYTSKNIILTKKLHQEVPFYIGGRVLRITDGPNNSLLYASGASFSVVKENKNTYYSSIFSPSTRIEVLATDYDENILIGTRKGLYKLQDGDFNATPELLCSGHITDIVKGPQNTIWLLTHGSGVLLLHNNVPFKVSEVSPLSSKFCTHGFADDRGNIWVGTNKGLNKIIINSLDQHLFTVESYTQADGLPSHQINDIDQCDDFLLIATNVGLTAVDIQQLSTNAVAPNVQLRNISLNQQLSALNDTLVIPPGSNELLLELTGISFRHSEGLSYQYQLLGIDQHWVTSANRSIRYTNLAPGQYTFYAKASNKDGIWSTPKKLLTLDVQPLLTQTTSFKATAAIASVTLFSLFFLGIVNTLQKQERNKRKRITAEQTALRAQMNPHFIFNALNAIQLFVAQNQKKEANIYLSDFSYMMRQVLDTSSKRFISLREEIHTLELYLKIEMLRFEDTISYSIETDPTLEIDNIFIPPMLLQPLLENALWHGLSPKKEGGLIQLYFQSNELFLQCTICDNGIGRKQATYNASQKNRTHSSKGLSNIKERLQLEFPKYNINELLIFKDLESNGIPQGTMVYLNIPLKTYKDIWKTEKHN